MDLIVGGELKRDDYCVFCLKINMCVDGGVSSISTTPTK